MPEDRKRSPVEDDDEGKAPSLDGVARRIEKLSLAVAEQTERLLAKPVRADGDLETILDAARRSSELARELVVLARRERDAAAATLLSVTSSLPPSSNPPIDSVPVHSQRRVRRDAGPPVVLLVDDEPLLLKTMLRMIEGYGLRVLSATSAIEALALAAGQPEIDLLVADLLLPGMSGSELVKKLRVSRPDLRVLYMSGWDPASSGVSISNDRREAFLSKPFSAAELDACFAELLGTPRQRSADRR